jgi:hypothetical protein
MLDLPTYVYPFIFAAVAALAGRLLGGRIKDDPGFPGWMLYAVAAGCLVIGFATLWLEHSA